MPKRKRGEFKPWGLSDALELIREIQPEIRALNYHVCLGGGVLNKGQSDKDLDLWILPLNGYESNPRPIMEWALNLFGPCHALRDSPDYGPDAHPHAREMVWVEFEGKRIDLFIQ